MSGKGKKSKIVLGCERHGRYVGVDIGCSRARSTKKCGCLFRLKATPLNPPDWDWKVRVTCGIHNHEPHRTCPGLAIFGRLNKEERSLVEEHLMLNEKAQNSLEAIKKRFAYNLSTIKQMYRSRRTFQSGQRGYRTKI